MPNAHYLDPVARRAVESRLKAELGVGVTVRLVEPGTVPRTEVGKAVRIRRWAGGEPPLPGLS